MAMNKATNEMAEEIRPLLPGDWSFILLSAIMTGNKRPAFTRSSICSTFHSWCTMAVICTSDQLPS